MLSTPLLVVRKSYQVTATEACLHGYRMLLSLLLSPCSNKNLHDILAKSLWEFYFHLDSCIISAYDLLCSMPMTKVTWQFSSASALLWGLISLDELFVYVLWKIGHIFFSAVAEGFIPFCYQRNWKLYLPVPFCKHRKLGHLQINKRCGACAWLMFQLPLTKLNIHCVLRRHLGMTLCFPVAFVPTPKFLLS